MDLPGRLEAARLVGGVARGGGLLQLGAVAFACRGVPLGLGPLRPRRDRCLTPGREPQPDTAERVGRGEQDGRGEAGAVVEGHGAMFHSAKRASSVAR